MASSARDSLCRRQLLIPEKSLAEIGLRGSHRISRRCYRRLKRRDRRTRVDPYGARACVRVTESAVRLSILPADPVEILLAYRPRRVEKVICGGRSDVRGRSRIVRNVAEYSVRCRSANRLPMQSDFRRVIVIRGGQTRRRDKRRTCNFSRYDGGWPVKTNKENREAEADDDRQFDALRGAGKVHQRVLRIQCDLTGASKNSLSLSSPRRSAQELIFDVAIDSGFSDILLSGRIGRDEENLPDNLCFTSDGLTSECRTDADTDYNSATTAFPRSGPKTGSDFGRSAVANSLAFART